jgi:hypothetical protein
MPASLIRIRSILYVAAPFGAEILIREAGWRRANARRQTGRVFNGFFFHLRKEELLMAMIYEKNKLYMVPRAEIHDDPRQARKFMDPAAFEELTASIKQLGIIQPVVCRQDPVTSLVYNVAGGRRCAAAGLAGLTEVPGGLWKVRLSSLSIIR